MKRPLLIAVLLIVCVNAGVFLGFFSNENARRVAVNENALPSRQVACGPLCLRIAANLYGIPCDEAHALSLCPPDVDGTCLADLQKSAPKFGLEANTVQLTWDELLTMKEFAILHVNDDHYVLADPNTRNGDNIRIYDYDIGARWYNQRSLEAIWKGTSLALAKAPNFKFPSLISTPTYWIEKGDYTDEHTLEYSFIVKNASAKPIELKIGPTSCQCSSATLEQETLESGEETTLTAMVKLEGKRGGFRERVVLFSLCGDEKRADSFILSGTIIQDDIISAARVFSGTNHRGGTICETFAVHDPGNGQLHKVEAFFREPISWLNPKITCKKVTDVDPQSVRKLNVKPCDWIVTLSAEVGKDAAIHRFKLPVIIQTNLEPPLGTMEVSLEGEIVPAISIEPAALIFSDQTRDQQKTLLIKSLVPSLRLPTPQIRFNNSVPLSHKSKRVSDQELLIEIRQNVGDVLSSDTLTCDIVLDFGKEGTINVPIIY